MKASAIIALLSAAGLHAGLMRLPRWPQPPATAAVEIEVGLETGDAEPGVSPLADSQALPFAEPEELPSPPEEVTSPPLPPSTAPPVLIQETPPPPPVAAEPAEEAPKPPPAAPATSSRPAPVSPASVATSRPSRSPAAPGPAKKVSSSTGSGTNTSMARYLVRSPLRYPNGLWRQHIGGRVVLMVDINEYGRPVQVSVRSSSGRSELDAAAVACARQSIFEPYRVNGQPQPCRMVAPFEFGR